MVFPFVLMRMAGVRIPYLLTLQDGDPFERVFKRKRIRPFLPLLTYGFRNAARVQAISTYLLGWARRVGYAGPGEVIPNGVSGTHFAQTFSDEETRYVRDELGAGEHDTLLVTTSRLVHKNGIDTVIDALSQLPDTVKFVIAGVGPLEDALKARVEMRKLAKQVIFLGEVPQSEMPLLLAACDIFIRPSRTEGQGVSFMEAMAAGLPIIATQEGGLADFLFDKNRNPDTPPTGFAVDVDAPDQIAETVKAIIADPAGTREVVENARSLVQTNYDWDAIAPRMRGMLVSDDRAEG
jgi:phosphatidylinositol alpha-1,6-mannosyltransferase